MSGDGAAIALFPGVPATATPTLGTASINQVRVAPVTASGGMMSVLPVQLSAALLGVMPTKFSGEQREWPEWKRRWLAFLENVEQAMPGITDAQTLTILKGLLDDASVHRLEAEQILDPELGYDQFLASLDLEFGGDSVANLRTRWYGHKLTHRGSVRLSDWRSFSHLFKKLMIMVEDSTEEEAGRLMIDALPVEYQLKLEEEVQKRNRAGLLILEGLPSSLDEKQVTAFINIETGHAPKSIEPIAPGKWRIRCVDDAHRASTMQLNRQHLDSGVRLGVRQVEERLKVNDIDQLMHRWLKVTERVSRPSKSERQEHPRREEERRQRFTREVLAEADAEEAADQEQMVARVEAPKSPRSTETHPNKGKGKGGKSNPPEETKKELTLSPDTQPQAQGSGDSGAATSPSPQSNYLSPVGPGWGVHPPQQLSWDPTWGAGWYQGYAEAYLGKGSGGQGLGKGSGGQGFGKGSGDKGKGKGKAGEGKGGRGHP